MAEAAAAPEDERHPGSIRLTFDAVARVLAACRGDQAGSGRNSSMAFSVSIIGSFRRHYKDVVLTAEEFKSLGVTVSSPAISRIINPGASYVRFEIDPPQSSDQFIQAAALQRILSSDLVYVVAPGGYVGLTTCYELGRIHERGIPAYFSDIPRDLPIEVSPGAVLEVNDLVRKVTQGR